MRGSAIAPACVIGCPPDSCIHSLKAAEDRQGPARTSRDQQGPAAVTSLPENTKLQLPVSATHPRRVLPVAQRSLLPKPDCHSSHCRHTQHSRPAPADLYHPACLPRPRGFPWLSRAFVSADFEEFEKPEGGSRPSGPTLHADPPVVGRSIIDSTTEPRTQPITDSENASFFCKRQAKDGTPRLHDRRDGRDGVSMNPAAAKASAHGRSPN